MKNLSLMNLTLPLLFVGVMTLISCSKDDVDIPDQKEEYTKYTGDEYGNLKSPLIHYSPKLDYTHETIWSCVEFGSYPQAEILPKATIAVEDYALDEDNVIIDAILYDQLVNAAWTRNETTVGDHRFRRMTSTDAVSWTTNGRVHYRWGSGTEYHYFMYQPVRWRILNITGTKTLLMADKALDCQRFHNSSAEVNWSTCDYRAWLNSDVYNSIFSEEEKQSVLLSDIRNVDNYYFGTSSGPDTKDYLFILSEEETFCSEKAVDYGFLETDDLDDPARRFRPTMYAKCRGCWITPVENYKGNTFWFMRSTGYTPYNVTYVCEFGYLYNRGTIVTCEDSGVIPAVYVDLSTAKVKVVEPVSSNTIIQ